MQLIRVVSVSAEGYVAEKFQHRIRPPVKCPHCGQGRTLLALGYYERNVTHPPRRILRIAVRRFRCLTCRRTVSILPSFAQPYRLVQNPTIHGFFFGAISVEVVSWEAVLKHYWARFARWVPEISRVVGTALGRAPPARDAVEWWNILVTVFGNLDTITKEFVTRYGVTLFGRYRCHAPNPTE